MLPELLGTVYGSNAALVITSLVGLVVAAWYLKSWYRLRRFSGPRLGAWSYLYMLRVNTSGRMAVIYRDVHQKYNSRLVRIGPRDLITNDPELIRRMNGARSTYSRSDWYDAMRMDPYDASLFSMRDTAEHDKFKAKMSFGYGGKENPGLEDGIDEQLGALVGLIRRKYLSTDSEPTKPLDLAITSQYFTLDVITKIAYGREAGYLATDSDPMGYIAASEEQVPFLAMLGDINYFCKIFLHPVVLSRVGPKITDKKGIGKILGVADDLVNKRFATDAKDQRDMLGSFIRHGVTAKQCKTEIPFQIIAGSDTVATSLRMTMLYLMNSPRAYGRLQKEIDDTIAAGKASTPIKSEEGKKLEYLQAVIYEGLRMQNPFAGLTMKQVPPQGDTYNGVFIPGGTRIAQNMLALLRLPDVYGQDVEVFRPERWLGLSAERRKSMADTVEMVFGYGRFGCAGKPVAFMELNKVYFELLRYFDFQLIDPRNPMREINHNMFFQSDMWVRVTERKTSQSRGS